MSALSLLLRVSALLLLVPLGSCASDSEMREKPAEFSISSRVPTDKLVECIFTGMLGADRDHSISRTSEHGVLHITANSLGIDRSAIYDIAITRGAGGAEVELRTALLGGTPYATEGVIGDCARS